ncbi:MAG: DNA polymerase III subunit gamma/tau [bacterium]
MATLYRKYRPQTFSEVIGQNHLKITIQHQLEQNEIGHAYLFCGPRGLGKTTTARLFAKSVNCYNRKPGESEPCNTCESCREIIAGHSVDVIEIDAASNTGVDNVRENIIESARFTPNKSKFKIFIIDEVHMLSTSAFNALLKTLEEPPVHVIFILCTTETHKLPETIISRCQRFDLKKVGSAELFKRLQHIVGLEGKKVDDEVIKNIIVHSDSCVRDAESLLGKILTLGDHITAERAELVIPRSDFQSVIRLLEYIAEKNTTAGIELVNKLVDDGVDLQSYVEDVLEFLRKIMLLKVNDNLDQYGIQLSEEYLKSAKKLAVVFSFADLLSAIELLIKKGQELKSAIIEQLPLELAVVELTQGVVCQREPIFNFSSGNNGGVKKEVKEIVRPAVKIEAPIVKIEAPAKIETKEEEPIKLEEEVIAPTETIESEEAPIVEISGEVIRVDFGMIKKNWHNLVEKLLSLNYPLSSIMKMSQPLRVHKDMVEIGVSSKFYKQQVEIGKNRQHIEDVLTEINGGPVKIEVTVKPELANLVVNQAPSFGGGSMAPASVPVANRDVLQEVSSLF